MQENYGSSLAAHVGADVPLRTGAPFQVVWNCPSGDWTHWETPRFKLTDMWLSTIQGDITGQLVFARNAGGGDVDTELGYFAQQTKALWPALAAPFGSNPPPAIKVLSPTWAANASGIRARAWAAPLFWPLQTACTIVAVANANTRQHAEFTLLLQPAPVVSPDRQDTNATRIFDAIYNVTISAEGKMSDWIQAGGVNLYRFGTACPTKLPGLGLQTLQTWVVPGVDPFNQPNLS